MTAIVEHDPFALIVDVFNVMYPERDCFIEYVEGLREETGAWGKRTFPMMTALPQSRSTLIVPSAMPLKCSGMNWPTSPHLMTKITARIGRQHSPRSMRNTARW